MKARFRSHKHDSKKEDYLFYKAIRKYGWSSFLFQVIEECCPLLRNERENYWIDYWHSLDREFGYNLQRADCTFQSEETIQKRIKACAGKKTHGRI